MLREPIGKYPVGVRKYDTGYTKGVLRPRRVPLTFYYPSKAWDKECPYRNAQYQRLSPDPPDNGVHTFCGEDAGLIDEPVKLPVVLYNHGLSGHEMESTVLCADIASMGYLVVSIGHPYGATIVTYIDGSRFTNPEPFEEIRFHLDRIEPLWYEDILVSMDHLKEMNDCNPIWKGRMDLNSIGVMGVSFGGCCSVAAVLKNADLTYAVNIDGSMFVQPEYIFKDKPIYIMCSPLNHKSHVPLTQNGCTNVIVDKVKKVSHYEFSDGIYLSDKGKSNREWAGRISRARAEKILDFIASLH